MGKYDELKLDELKDLAKERELKGRSGKNHAELASLLEEDDALSAEAEASGHSEEALKEYQEEYVPQRREEVEDAAEEGVPVQDELDDPENPLVEEALEDRESYQELSDTDKDLAALSLDVAGPDIVQSPYDRVMTGAQSEEQAKQQEEVRAKLPADFVGDLTEAVSDEDADRVRRNLEEGPKDFPLAYEPPLIEQFRARRNRYAQLLRRSGQQIPDGDPSSSNTKDTQGNDERGTAAPPFNQRAVLYTDGVSGPADGLDRAYHTSDVREGRFNDLEKNPRTDEIREAERNRVEKSQYGN